MYTQFEVEDLDKIDLNQRSNRREIEIEPPVSRTQYGGNYPFFELEYFNSEM